MNMRTNVNNHRRTPSEMRELTYPSLLRYAEFTLRWFVEFCKSHDLHVRMTQWNLKDLPTVHIHGMGWELISTDAPREILYNVHWLDRLMNLDYAMKVGFKRIYNPIADECERAARAIRSMREDYSRERVLMWLRCSMRLGLVQDLRIFVGRMVASDIGY